MFDRDDLLLISASIYLGVILLIVATLLLKAFL